MIRAFLFASILAVLLVILPLFVSAFQGLSAATSAL